MNIEAIISDLDQQIARLRQARKLLMSGSEDSPKRRGRAKGSGKKTAEVPPPEPASSSQ